MGLDLIKKIKKNTLRIKMQKKKSDKKMYNAYGVIDFLS